MKFLLDTSFVVNYLRHRGKWEKEIVTVREKGNVAVSLISYGELLYGALRAKNFEKEKRRVAGFIGEFEVELAVLGSVEIELFSRAKFELETRGARLDDFDLLIGATAVANDFVLVTDNQKHFERFPKIKLYHWDQERG